MPASGKVCQVVTGVHRTMAVRKCGRQRDGSCMEFETHTEQEGKRTWQKRPSSTRPRAAGARVQAKFAIKLENGFERAPKVWDVVCDAC